MTGAPAAKTQTFTLTVTDPVPDFALALVATPNATVIGQNVTWSGTVTALHGYSGSVNLSCAGTVPATCTVNPTSVVAVPAGGVFTVTVANSSLGAFNFSIQGTDGTLTHTQAVNLVVNTDVTWSDTGTGASTVQAGQSATYSFSASPVGGATFSGAVGFACANLPALSSCSFSPSSISAGMGTTPSRLRLRRTGPNGGGAAKSRRSFPDRIHVIVGSQEIKSPGSPLLKTPVALGWLLTFSFAGLGMAVIGRKRKRGDLITGSLIVLLGLAILVACGGAVGGGGGTQPLIVTVSPAIATVATGGQQKFTASQSATWAVSGGSANGTIDGSGLYTAPGVVPNPPSFTVTAASSAAGSSPGIGAGHGDESYGDGYGESGIGKRVCQRGGEHLGGVSDAAAIYGSSE